MKTYKFITESSSVIVIQHNKDLVSEFIKVKNEDSEWLRITDKETGDTTIFVTSKIVAIQRLKD